MKTYVIASALALASLATPLAALAAEDAKAVCDGVETAYKNAVATGDPAKVAALFAPEGEHVSPWGPFVGPAAIAKFYGGSIKPGASLSVQLTSTRAFGDAVVCTGGWEMTTPASPTPFKGFFTKVEAKVGDDWKILSLTSNLTPPK